MLSAPFVGSGIYCKKTKSDILKIRQDKIKDARYFGKSFSIAVEKNLETRAEGKITLSKEEEYIDGDAEVIDAEVVEKLVVCMNDFTIPDGVKHFGKEIYSAGNFIKGVSSCSLRVAYAKKRMVLGDNTVVERWVDAEETLAIYDDCDLGLSASAGQRMSIGKDCLFKRLYSQEILIGQYPDSYNDPLSERCFNTFDTTKNPKVVRNIKTIDEDLLNEFGEADITVLTKYQLNVPENTTVRGDIRSEKGMNIGDGTIVCGNVFAEEDVHIGKNVTLLGNVFTQGSIYVEEGVMIGHPGKIVSVIARNNIVFEKNIAVFGYVSAGYGGKVVASNMENAGKECQILELPVYTTELCFNDVEQYNNIDGQGFRKKEFLKLVEINVPATYVRGSMFYGCSSLDKVVLPRELEEIGDYAFAECKALSDITSFADTNLKSIGNSAFAECKKLKKLEFPVSVEMIGNAAFSGCEDIEEIVFPTDAKLKTIGTHCFKGCSKVRVIELPDSIENVGMSCFMNCEALEKVIVPAGSRSLIGIRELLTDSNVQVISRELKM